MFEELSFSFQTRRESKNVFYYYRGQEEFQGEDVAKIELYLTNKEAFIWLNEKEPVKILYLDEIYTKGHLAFETTLSIIKSEMKYLFRLETDEEIKQILDQTEKTETEIKFSDLSGETREYQNENRSLKLGIFENDILILSKKTSDYNFQIDYLKFR